MQGEKTEHCVAPHTQTAVSVAWQLQLFNRNHFNFYLTPFSLLQLFSVFHCLLYFPTVQQQYLLNNNSLKIHHLAPFNYQEMCLYSSIHNHQAQPIPSQKEM